MSEKQDTMHHEGVGHIVPLKLLVGVFGALLVLTAITVAASWVNLGELNVWIALGIACVKGSLVVLFFMHLFWDRPMAAVIFVTSVLLVGLFIGLALTDYQQYMPDLIPGYAPAIDR